MFATSGFGVLFVRTPKRPWVVDTHNGEVIESDMDVHEMLLQLVEPTTREDLLRERLFARYRELAGPIAVDSILCPAPAPALGGTWDVVSLRPTALRVFLSFSAQLFDPDGGTPMQVFPLAD